MPSHFVIVVKMKINQASPPLGPTEISILVELKIGRQRNFCTDVPTQPFVFEVTR